MECGVGLAQNFADHLATVVRPFAGVLVKEFRVEVGALAGEHTVVVKAGGFDVKMPFPNHGGLVTEIGQYVRQHDFVRGDGVGEGAHAIDVGILAGE